MQNQTTKLIILDRDGVINMDSDKFIKSPEEWLAIDASLEAITLLNQAGYTVVVATNQSGIHRGLFDMDVLNAMHQKMHQALKALGGRIDAIFFCPHTADEKCGCRKPKAGMLEEIAMRYSINLKNVPLVGDSLRDLQAGQLMDCELHLVLTGKGYKTLNDPLLPKQTIIHDNLYQFAQFYIQENAQDLK